MKSSLLRGGLLLAFLAAAGLGLYRLRAVEAGASPGTFRLASMLEGAEVETAGAGPQARPLVLAKDLREAIVCDGSTRIRLEVVLPELAVLRFSLGARRVGGNAGVRARFRVLAGRGDELRELFDESFELAQGTPALAWQERSVELAELGAGPCSLVLESEGEGGHLRLAWGSPCILAERPGTPVILVSIDTLGSAHSSLYGYERKTTPALENLANDAVVFEQAICQQSWTLTSHMSLMTGLYPDTHRVTKISALAADLPLLPAILRERGYFTLGLVNVPYLYPSFGYTRGYDAYQFDSNRVTDGVRLNRDFATTRALLDPLLEPLGNQPFFLFLHAFDCHSDWRDEPYEVPEPFQSMFVEGVLGSVETCCEGECATYLLGAVNDGECTLSAEQVEAFTAHYDGGVAYTDAQFGLFIEDLKARGLYEDALIVVTSDHGEEFLEHGRTMHVQGYDDTIRVPLLIKFPRSEHAGLRVPEQVELIDVLPTVLDVLKLETPALVEGSSLMSLIRGEGGHRPYAISKGGNGNLDEDDTYVLRSSAWKLIWCPGEDSVELYNLLADPGELRDLSEQEPERAEALRAILVDHRARAGGMLSLRISALSGQEGTLSGRLEVAGTVVRLRSHDFRRQLDGGTRFRLVRDDTRVEFEIDSADSAGRPPAEELGFDFETDPPGAELRLELHWNGRPLEARRLRLGDGLSGARALPAVFETRERLSGPRVARERWIGLLAELPDGPLVHLWATDPLRGEAVELSATSREVLRGLGYTE